MAGPLGDLDLQHLELALPLGDIDGHFVIDPLAQKGPSDGRRDGDEAVAGVGFTIVEFKIDFVRPITITTGKVQAEGTTVKVGQQIGLADGVLRDVAGNVLAKGTTTCLIFRP